MRYILFFLLISVSFGFMSADNRTTQEFCGLKNDSWQSGEKVIFHVYYTLAGIYIYGGEASFSIQLSSYNQLPAYSIVGEGKTNSFFDQTPFTC